MPNNTVVRVGSSSLRQTDITEENLHRRDELYDTDALDSFPMPLGRPPQLVQQPTVNLERLEAACDHCGGLELNTLTPLLPLLFSMKGDPYTLDNYFPFEPMFRATLPTELTMIAGRQVSKSTSMAARMIALSVTKNYFNSLYVAPLFEMTRRFSSGYVNSFIEQSPVRGLMIDSGCNRSVLQRTFRSHSSLYFSFAYLDPSRIRGISTDLNYYDEAQDLDPDHVPIIKETMSGSPYALSVFAGTAKTFSAFLHDCWRNSSQAEWHVHCIHCGFENIPAKAYHLDLMIGPDRVRREISERLPGVVCAKCQKSIYPRLGHWVHHYPDRLPRSPGYHIPQIIMPMHYANSEKWATLLGKRMLAPNVFYNEVCGESYDIGAKLVSESDLRAACNPNRENSLEEVYKAVAQDRYIDRIVSVDWGGGGETEISRTVVVALGLKPDFSVDVLFGRRFRMAGDVEAEVAGIWALMRALKTPYLVHDFGGQGVIREEYLVRCGFKQNYLIPVQYVPHAAKSMMRLVPEDQELGTRAHYQVNKTRSLLQTCSMIKQRLIEFYACDYINRDQPGLIFDFLALVENVAEGKRAGDTYMIIRASQGKGKKGVPDDFAQAVNIGVCGLFYKNGRGGVAPNLGMTAAIRERMERASATYEIEDKDWDLISSRS